MEIKKNYNPDILTCISNLSSDEVFTSPHIAKLILDNLPNDLWEDEKIKFLDPVSKTGVFLREITIRLIRGLQKKIPNLEKRINHILRNQVYGLSITELTSLISRRTLYCSKYANSKFSISKFNDIEGNIKFISTKHSWNSKNICAFCGVNKELYDRNKKLENYAYSFIHEQNLNKVFDMKFDVIIGNPPYQMSDGGGGGGSAKPVYNKFINTAKRLNPRYLTMIIPSRWYSGGKGLDEFREEMLNDKRISKIVDFPDSSDCFPGVEIKGGVCYFLWERDYSGECEITNINKSKKNIFKRPLLEKDLNFFIRYNQSISIIRKVLKFKDENFSSLVSTRKPFGISDFKGKSKKNKNDIKIFYIRGFGYIDEKKILTGKENIKKHKVFISKAYGAGEGFPHQIINKPFYGETNSVCTETYLHIGPFSSKLECENVISYIKTKFFRFLVLMIKNTQNTTRSVYRLVPIQNFEKKWNDKLLYKKYDLTQNEIKFIEDMIRPMD